MVKILLVSHGNLAESFRDTAAMIAGSETAAGICCLGMTPEKDPEEFAEEAGRLLAEDLQADYLIFADLFASYRMVTGMNLGAILDAVFQKDTLSLEELYQRALETAKDGVRGVTLHV